LQAMAFKWTRLRPFKGRPGKPHGFREVLSTKRRTSPATAGLVRRHSLHR